MTHPVAETGLVPHNRRLWPTVAVAAGVLCYLGALFNQFAYDDVQIVRDNPRTHNLADFRQIWLTDWWAQAQTGEGTPDPARDRLYRPLTLFSFALNYAVHGVAPLGYHLVNLVLHALACWLVWLLVLRLFDDDLIAGITSLIFALHPIHAEAVASVVGRAEILSTVLMLAGLLILLPRSGESGYGRILLSLPIFAAALLAKETAVLFPAAALIVLHAAARTRRSINWYIPRAALLVLPVLAYLPLRYVALGERLVRAPIDSLLFLPLHEASWFERLHAPFTILGHYVRLIFFSTNLSCDYGPAIFDPRRGPDLTTALGLFVAAALIAGLFGYKSAASTLRRRLAICAALFITAYALISNSIILIGISFADRLMYWPSVPIFMAAGVYGAHLWRTSCIPNPRRRKFSKRMAVLLLIAFGLRTALRTADWKNTETLFAADLKIDPDNPVLSCGYAGILLGQARLTEDNAELLDRAATLLNRAVETEPRYAEALARLGEVYILAGRQNEAAQALERALLLNPADVKSKRLLADLKGDDGVRRARITELQQILTETPHNLAARAELIRLLIDAADLRQALAQAETAARANPENPAILKLYAEALVLNQRREDAAQTYRRVLQLAPADGESHSNLVALLSATDPAAALYHAQVAAELRPDDLRTQINLAEAYALNGHTDEALKRLRDIARRLPADNPHRPLVTARIAELERLAP